MADVPVAVEFDGYFLRVLGEWGRYSHGVAAADAGSAGVADLRRHRRCRRTATDRHPRQRVDPLRDEGIAFFRTLLAAGVTARCDTVMGTMHAVEAIPNVCPEISRAAARDIVGHAG